MTTNHLSKLAAGLSVTALALIVQHPVLAEDVVPATQATTAPPTEQPSAPRQHPADAARAAMEERRADHMAELNKRYAELRKQAAGHGFQMPPAPPWTEGPQWLSFEEMQERMKEQGITMEPPTSGATPTPPSVSTPAAVKGRPEEQKRIFDTIEKMTPEQQQACFAMSRWHTPRIPPAYSRRPTPQYPPGYVPRYGQPYRGMMRPQ